MPNLNKVMLMGNITRDPEVRYTPKGTAVTDIALAINRSYSLDDGERREETTYVDVTYWGRQAEIIGEYMKKGRPIYVEGRLQLDQWEDKTTGQNRSRLKVVGDNFQFLGTRGDDGGGGGGGGGGQSYGGSSHGSQGGGQSYGGGQPHQSSGAPSPSPAPQQPQQPTGYEPIQDDDDIPF